MVGTDAMPKSVSMGLDLGAAGGYAALQKSLVIHEFGHALGLEHEHQRSDFWEVLGEYIDDEKMKEDSLVKTEPLTRRGNLVLLKTGTRRMLRGQLRSMTHPASCIICNRAQSMSIKLFHMYLIQVQGQMAQGEC